MDFVVFLQGIATFFEDILFFAARYCIGTLVFLERTCFYFFTRLNKNKTLFGVFDRWVVHIFPSKAQEKLLIHQNLYKQDRVLIETSYIDCEYIA